MPRPKSKDKTIRKSIVLPIGTETAIGKIAARDAKSFSDVVRKFIDEGLKVQMNEDSQNEMRKIIHEEIKLAMRPEVERIIKVVCKGSITSATSLFISTELTYMLMADAFMRLGVVPPEFQRDYETVMEKAKKKAVAYVKNTDSQMANQGW